MGSLGDILTAAERKVREALGPGGANVPVIVDRNDSKEHADLVAPHVAIALERQLLSLLKGKHSSLEPHEINVLTVLAEEHVGTSKRTGIVLGDRDAAMIAR